MPRFTVGSALVNPASSLTAGTKYVVQNQSGSPVRFAVASAAFTTPTDDSLVLGGSGGYNQAIPSHLEYTYAATDHVRLWSDTGLEATVVFHALG